MLFFIFWIFLPPWPYQVRNFIPPPFKVKQTRKACSLCSFPILFPLPTFHLPSLPLLSWFGRNIFSTGFTALTVRTMSPRSLWGAQIAFDLQISSGNIVALWWEPHSSIPCVREQDLSHHGSQQSCFHGMLPDMLLWRREGSCVITHLSSRIQHRPHFKTLQAACLDLEFISGEWWMTDTLPPQPKPMYQMPWGKVRYR